MHFNVTKTSSSNKIQFCLRGGGSFCSIITLVVEQSKKRNKTHTELTFQINIKNDMVAHFDTAPVQIY